jgi:hypothetical protein
LSCPSIFCPMLISTDFFLFINILPYVDIHWFCLVHPYSSLCWIGQNIDGKKKISGYQHRAEYWWTRQNQWISR